MQRGLPQLASGALVAIAVAACGPRTGSIGAVLGQSRDGRLFARDVPPALAASRAGLRAGDELLAIDGRDVRAMSAQEVHAALEGPVGSEVRLTVLRGGEIVRMTIERAPLSR